MQPASTIAKRAPRAGRSTLAWTTAAVIASNWALIAQATSSLAGQVDVEHQRNLFETEMAADMDVVDLKQILFAKDQNDSGSDQEDGNDGSEFNVVASLGDLRVQQNDDSSDEENSLEEQDEAEIDSVSSLSSASSDESSSDEKSSDEDLRRRLSKSKRSLRQKKQKHSQIWKGYDKLEARFEELKQKNEDLESQLTLMTSSPENLNLAPELDYFWNNDSEKTIQPVSLDIGGGMSLGRGLQTVPSAYPMLDGDGTDSAFCVEGNKVLAFEASCVIGSQIVDQGDNMVTMYLTKDGTAIGRGEQLATSSRKQKGKTQSLSLFYKGLVEETAEFQLFILNSFSEPITLKAKECQIGFQIYNGDDYPLSEAVPSCE